tara:strand:- start:2502 stop:2741 length:240 start_codon:yes stop_codon:yes gene_type:complete
MSEENVGFEELVLHINNAIKFVESEVNEEFDVIVENSHQSLEFVAGHIMGMRDAMIAVQNILARTIFGEPIQPNSEEEE